MPQKQEKEEKKKKETFETPSLLESPYLPFPSYSPQNNLRRYQFEPRALSPEAVTFFLGYAGSRFRFAQLNLPG